MRRAQPERWPVLDDVHSIRAGDLLHELQLLIKKRGEDTIIVFDAGYNNISVTLETK